MKNTIDTVQYRGVFRSTRIPPCVISRADLRRLYANLEEKAAEALERHISEAQKPEERTDEEWRALMQHVRAIGGLTTIVVGANGEENVAQSVTPLTDEQLPDRIKSVVFDSAVSLQNKNINPPDRFRLVIDFSEPPIFGTYNPWEIPTPNNSVLEVTGANTTWATGVYESALSFFRTRIRRRGWFHTPLS